MKGKVNIKEKYKKNKNKKRSTFFASVLGGFILYTLILAVLVIVGVFLTLFRTTYFEEVTLQRSLTDMENQMKEGQYANIDIESIVGENSFIAVLDEKQNVIYQGNRSFRFEFSAEEISWISHFNGNELISKSNVCDTNGRPLYVVTNLYVDDSFNFNPTSDEELDLNVGRILIVDQNYNIVYSNYKQNFTKFTKEQFDLYTGQFNEDYTVKKITFTNNSNNYRTMLIFDYIHNEVIKTERVVGQALIAFLICYIILIVFFAFYLSNLVKKPIKELTQAIDNFEYGKTSTSLVSKAPRELVDISKKFKEMTEELVIEQRERTRLEELKQKMIADISHDLKTPITSILGYAKAINSGIVQSDHINQYLRIIENKAVYITELINDFHQYNKSEHPDFKLDLKTVEIYDFVRNFLADRYEEISLSGFNLVADINEGESALVKIDPLEFKKVLSNLLANSLKYNAIGTNIICNIKTYGKFVEINFGDNGIGILEEMKESIFEPFTVGDTSRSAGGSGLGLAIVKRIVDLHGGSIEMVEDDKENKFGIMFRIVIEKI